MGSLSSNTENTVPWKILTTPISLRKPDFFVPSDVIQQFAIFYYHKQNKHALFMNCMLRKLGQNRTYMRAVFERQHDSRML